MTFKYDKELNIIRILFDSTALVEQSDEYNGVILDWTAKGGLLELRYWMP